jgi:hypothetical protein
LFHDQVKKEARLSGAMAQCCFDTATWMWKSYREAHKTWRREVAISRWESDKFWLAKLLRRKPQEPFTNGTSGKVPIWFDGRIGARDATVLAAMDSTETKQIMTHDDVFKQLGCLDVIDSIPSTDS